VVEGRVAEGRVAEGRVAEGRVAEGRVAEGCVAEGHVAGHPTRSRRFLKIERFHGVAAGDHAGGKS
jgi:hypothetical protein